MYGFIAMEVKEILMFKCVSCELRHTSKTNGVCLECNGNACYVPEVSEVAKLRQRLPVQLTVREQVWLRAWEANSMRSALYTNASGCADFAADCLRYFDEQFREKGDGQEQTP